MDTHTRTGGHYGPQRWGLNPFKPLPPSQYLYVVWKWRWLVCQWSTTLYSCCIICRGNSTMKQTMPVNCSFEPSNARPALILFWERTLLQLLHILLSSVVAQEKNSRKGKFIFIFTSNVYCSCKRNYWALPTLRNNLCAKKTKDTDSDSLYASWHDLSFLKP